ncbi:hypothetical protein [Streptomyces xanthii]|uniref:Uncharacterized protein n=1 Tax=Streptomyces xanthii TaxID=2768069 RepID=A0A7H1BL51_9ACTN|nr:hypothetical protein [Streptomyces xanthii]QNS09456.1 hypothetical protein IAG42_37500 [Streptomyces xanthii]
MSHRQAQVLKRELQAVERQRDRDVAELDEFAQAHKEARADASRRSLARELGVTHPVITAMIERAKKDAYPTDSTPLVPVLSAYQATEYVRSGAFGQVTGALVAMSETDILLESGRHPKVFADGTRIAAPNTLLRNAEGELLGVEECLAGYGGTGPSNSLRLLRDLGWDEEVAREVFRHRFVEFDMERGVIRSSPDTLHHCGGNLEFTGGHLVARLRRGRAWDPYDRTPANDPLRLRTWVEEILSQPEKHPWAAGPRVARVYLNRDTAVGLQDRIRFRPGVRNSPFSVVIEQGELQLWCSAIYPSDWAELLSQEQLDVLAAADMYPAEVEPRGWLDRFLPRRRERPDYIDISTDGTGALRHEPDGTELDGETFEGA